MKRVWTLSALLLLSLGACVAPPPPPSAPLAGPAQPVLNSPKYDVARNLLSGQSQQLGNFFSLNPDCSLMGPTTVRVLQQPQHGKVSVIQSDVYPAFPSTNQRYACNLKPVRGEVVIYTSEPGYVGADNAVVEAYFPSANMQTVRYLIQVH